MRPQFSLDLNAELIVDNFAGGGGASTGIYLALGRHVDHAINHDRFALGMHRINHPQTIHHCEDVFDVDPAVVCEGRPVGLCHNSPDCKHFSKAKGGKPLDKRIRGLVLVMLKWAKYGARVMTMENVEEIVTWGPLKKLRKGGQWEWYADPKHKGRTWLAFLAILSTGIDPDHPDLPEILDVLGGYVTKAECVRGFGYAYEARRIRACDVGTPTIRKRLYMVARRDGMPIVWPEATHADPKVEARRLRVRGERKLKPYRTIAECLDWHLPCPSIFLGKAEAKRWRCKRPLAKSTLRRIAKGTDRYVLKAKRPFIVSVTHQGDDRIASVDDPARTVTGAHRGEKAVVVAKYHGDHQGREDGAERGLPVDEPLTTQDTSNRFGLTEAKLAPFVTEHANASGQRNMPVDEPARTVCGEVKGGHFAMVAGTLIQTGYGEREGQEPRTIDPNAHGLTVVAGGVKQAAVAATLIGAGGPAYSGKPKPVDVPMNAQTTENHAAIVTATLIGTGGPARAGEPRPVNVPGRTSTTTEHAALVAATLIGAGQSVGHAADEPGHTVTAGGGGKSGLVAAHLTKFCTGAVGQDLREPGPTVTAGSHSQGTHGGAATPQGLVAAYLAQHNGGFNETPGHPAPEPASTISAKGSQQQLVAAHLSKYYGTDQDPRLEEPSHTVTTKDRFGLVESTGVSPMTPEQIAGAHRVAAFLREHGVVFEGEFATVEGFVIVDLGMRMLTPRELFRAQGFGNDYVIDRAWVIDPTGALTEIRLTKEQQIRMCGNSVCPPVMAAIVRVNVPELSVGREAGSRKSERGSVRTLRTGGVR